MLRSCSDVPRDSSGADAAIGVVRIETIRTELPAVAARLQPRDRCRFEVSRTEKRREELLAGRWLLHSFSRHLGLPSALFDTAETGAGLVARSCMSGAPRLSASITHAGGWVACALACGAPVGIDLEPLVERDFAALAAAAFPVARLRQRLARAGGSADRFLSTLDFARGVSETRGTMRFVHELVMAGTVGSVPVCRRGCRDARC
jgi:4'-phosphopantetheinyl transferase EntD